MLNLIIGNADIKYPLMTLLPMSSRISVKFECLNQSTCDFIC